MKRFFLLLAIIALATVLPLSTASARRILNVPGDYPTIQTAIDAASRGDIVLVAPGEYVESITLKPWVTVKSAEGPEVTTIRGNGWYTWGNWGVFPYTRLLERVTPPFPALLSQVTRNGEHDGGWASSTVRYPR